MTEDILPLEQIPEIRELIARALAEDVGPGDVTTLALVEAGATAGARRVARQPVIVAGMGIAGEVFRMADPALQVEILQPDGAEVGTHTVLLRVAGPARGLLAAERTALNFAQRMTGIATATDCLVRIVADYGTLILDTRKTAPGLRRLDKHAVQCGGGTNHRVGLHDAVLIKDNHLAYWRRQHKGTLGDAVRAARQIHPGLKIEIEVDTLEQLADALPGRPDWVLLDNMTPQMVAAAVSLCTGICKTEASGGITRDNVREYARAGVTAISIGALTHSVQAADLALEFE
jgi:nicotinate-nucleotide pyrophosphorylase (carboxylating)